MNMQQVDLEKKSKRLNNTADGFFISNFARETNLRDEDTEMQNFINEKLLSKRPWIANNERLVKEEKRFDETFAFLVLSNRRMGKLHRY